MFVPTSACAVGAELSHLGFGLEGTALHITKPEWAVSAAPYQLCQLFAVDRFSSLFVGADNF